VDNRQRARELWEQSGGTLALKEIAEQLGLPLPTVKSWKRRDGWGKDAGMQQDASKARCTDANSKRRKAQVNRKAIESIGANEEMTDREKEFCIAFVYAPSAAQAAMKTGRYESYGAARTAAWDMMRKPAVRVEIKNLKAMKRAAMLADGDDVIEMHMRIAFADITEFVEFGRATVPVMGAFGPIYEEKGKNKKPVMKEINEVRFKKSAEVDGTLIAEVKQGKDGASVKLADRQKSLDFLERFFELDPGHKHKTGYDNARLKLEQEKLKLGNEEALEKLDGILAGVKTVMQDD